MNLPRLIQSRLAWGVVSALALAVGALVAVGAERPRWPESPARAVGPVSAAELKLRSRVVLITLDGARWQDVVDADGTVAALWERPLMPRTRTLLAQNGVALKMKTSSSVTLSLPGYHALLSGLQTRCEDNDCGRMAHETISDRLQQTFDLAPEQVATFASWAPLASAVSGLERPKVLIDVEVAARDVGPPWPDARWDRETFRLAMAHWQATRPRFLHVALLDTDETAHRRKLSGLKDSYLLADDVIGSFAEAFERLPPEERRLTTILVTADHGRDGRRWDSHTETVESEELFLLAIGDLIHGGTAEGTQADVRPTIERLFGLCPSGGTGRALGPIVGDLPCEG